MIKRRVTLFFKNAQVRIKRFVGVRRLSRVYRFLSLRDIIELLCIGAMLLFAAGILNGLLEGTNRALAGQIIVPSRNVQNLIETFIELFLIMVGTLGFYLLYLSSKQIGRQRVSNLYFVLGLTMMLLSVFMEIYVLQAKGGAF